ncbi:CLUMA_CG002834, isoform A [Clunio marinus]|nr:CLUMA_CG002834, isoform A [Clunio marinus]
MDKVFLLQCRRYKYVYRRKHLIYFCPVDDDDNDDVRCPLLDVCTYIYFGDAWVLVILKQQSKAQHHSREHIGRSFEHKLNDGGVSEVR